MTGDICIYLLLLILHPTWSLDSPTRVGFAHSRFTSSPPTNASSHTVPVRSVPSNVAPVTTALLNFTPRRLDLSKSTRSMTAFVMSAPSKLALTAYAYRGLQKRECLTPNFCVRKHVHWWCFNRSAFRGYVRSWRSHSTLQHPLSKTTRPCRRNGVQRSPVTSRACRDVHNAPTIHILYRHKRVQALLHAQSTPLG